MDEVVALRLLDVFSFVWALFVLDLGVCFGSLFSLCSTLLFFFLFRCLVSLVYLVRLVLFWSIFLLYYTVSSCLLDFIHCDGQWAMGPWRCINVWVWIWWCVRAWAMFGSWECVKAEISRVGDRG